jgi:hypothetical protein
VTHGISFPVDSEGDRPTSATGRGVVADALRPVDPVGARAAAQETAWRGRYLLHFRRLVEAGLSSPEAWEQIAVAGLDAVRRRLVVAGETGEADQPVESLLSGPRAES